MLEEGQAVYPNFKTIGAETGRMSCTEPNLQNQPREAAYRACYVAKKGYRLLIADYSQQEVRLMAQVSQDPELLGIFRRGDDVHQYVADELARLLGHSVERRFGKTLNLGLQYGLTSYGFALRTGVDRGLAKQLVDGYFQRFSGVCRWLQIIRQTGREQGYVETLGGRRIWLNLWQRQWENNAPNGVVQGSGADLIKRALGLVYNQLGEEGFPILGPIHDELVCEAKTKDVSRIKRIVTESMTTAFVELCPDVSTRGLVDVHIGLNWAAKYQE
jgi:DNA polymerase-1